MSSDGDNSSTEDQFNFESQVGGQRYPVHDCCEFEDVENLRKLIFVQQGPSDDDSSDSEQDDNGEDGSSSSSDDNDSHAAAHAAAVGHSPNTPIATTTTAPEQQQQQQQQQEATTSAAADTASVQDTAQPMAVEEDTVATSENDLNPPKVTVPIDTNDLQQQQRGENNEGQSGQHPVPISEVKESEEQNGNHDNALVAGEVTAEADDTTTASGAAVGGGELESEKKQAEKKPKKKAQKEISYYCPYNLNERDEDENTPLHIAIHYRKLEHVKCLLEARASVHKKCDGSAPIHTAISIGSIPIHANFAFECTAVLVENGADLSVRDESFQTPLYLACMYNLPNILLYILSNGEGLPTLNLKADRSGGRALHAAAKYDMIDTADILRQNHSRTSQTNIPHPPVIGTTPTKDPAAPSITQILLKTPGVEVDAKNNYGQTPLHMACMRGNWVVARLLLQAGAAPDVTDRRGFTPGQIARKRGMHIPNDILPTLGEKSSPSGDLTPRDLIVDPDSTTLLLCHELCFRHRSCPPIRRDGINEPPPENVRRLHVLTNDQDGILQSSEFQRCIWEKEPRRAAMADVLKIHEYSYVESICKMCSGIADSPSAIAHLDADTAISRWSFEAAMRAAGSVCEAVDRVVAGDFRNAFCAVRPPGHHAGPRGIVQCRNDPDGGSHGFCLLNNVAIGAAYARTMYRNEGIRKVAIIDFDVHHGNGTEEIVRQLIPRNERSTIRTPFAFGELMQSKYRPWLDESDIENVFFASSHGYGPRGIEFSDNPSQGGWFYPASGETQTTDAILDPSVVESPSNPSDFIMSQTWTRVAEESLGNCFKVINCGLPLPQPDAIPGMQRVELRDAYRLKILPHLREFDPDMIFISAGFDAHKRDAMNFGYVGMVEEDYEWLTSELVKVANSCCNGRIVSVLEGGYKIHGGIVSPFARSVASHVRALVDGGRSRELFDASDGEWDSQFERHTVEDRERRRQLKLERLTRVQQQFQHPTAPPHPSLQHHDIHTANLGISEEQLAAAAADVAAAAPAQDEEKPFRKRRRNNVDYKELYEEMKREGGL